MHEHRFFPYGMHEKEDVSFRLAVNAFFRALSSYYSDIYSATDTLYKLDTVPRAVTTKHNQRDIFAK